MLRQLRRRAASQKTVTLYRGIGTRGFTRYGNAPARERSVRENSSWTTSPGAARSFVRASIAKTSGTRVGGMVYAVDVPASQIRRSLGKMPGGGGEETYYWPPLKETGAPWSVGRDASYNFLELRPNKDMDGLKPGSSRRRHGQTTTCASPG